MELSEMTGSWSAIQIGTFKNQPNDSWLLNAGDRFVVERLGNGMTSWYAGVSQDASETIGRTRRVDGERRILQRDVGASGKRTPCVARRQRIWKDPSLVIAEGEGLDGVAVLEFTPTLGTNMSSPICPLALDDNVAGELVLAIQFYSNQVHTGRMSIEPVVSRVLELAQDGKPQLRIEGSASALSTSRDPWKRMDWPPIVPKTYATDWPNDLPLRDCLKALITTWRWSNGSNLMGVALE